MSDIQKKAQEAARNAHTVHTANCETCMSRDLFIERDRKRMSEKVNTLRGVLRNEATQHALLKAEVGLVNLELEDAKRENRITRGLRRKVVAQRKAILDLQEKLEAATRKPVEETPAPRRAPASEGAVAGFRSPAVVNVNKKEKTDGNEEA